MYKDKGPNYTLGFGIPQNKNPIETDHDGNQTKEGLSPNSGVIAHALYDHPVAKFFAVSAATMVGTAVGSAIVRRGGIRLGEKLGEGAFPFFKDAQVRLHKSVRDASKLFDEWEGVDSTLGRDAEHPVKRAGFWQNYEHRKMLNDQDLPDDNDRWLFRDEIQQRMIRQARSLPYQLPALFVANRAANSLVGNQNQPINWKNPFDVIGEFAETSTHQIAGLLAPVELGHGSLKFGWQKMMTDGDFVSKTSTFSNLKGYGVGLKVSLDKLGQDSVSLIHETTRRSSQVAGSFSNALKEATESRQPWGLDLLNHDQEYTKFRLKRAKLVQDAYNAQKIAGGGSPSKAAIQQALPTLSGFVRGFGQSWTQHDSDFANLEAARRREPADLHRVRTSSYITQLDTGIDVAKSDYMTKQKDEAYKSLLQEELAKKIAGGLPVGDDTTNAASTFIRAIGVDRPSGRSAGDTDPRTEMIKRVQFGTSPIFDENASWENQFQARLGALAKPRSGQIPLTPRHAESITNALPGALQAADRRFLDTEYSQQLEAKIGKNFEDIRSRVIVPEARRQLGESKLAYSDFGPGSSDAHQELLARKTAEHLGIPLRQNGVTQSTAQLRNQLRELGINSPYEMRGILLDQGAMAKPWQVGGFNFFGLRPLTVNTANEQNYFGSKKESVNKLFDEMAELDHPHSRHLINRPVGRHVWESRAGNIIDLNPTIQGLAKSAQVVSRHFELPFLHLNLLDLLSFNKLSDFANGPSVRIASSDNLNFGSINKQLSKEDYDAHVWIRDSAGLRGRGQVFGHRLGEEVGQASGQYYAPGTMGEDTWARSLRLARRERGIYDPDRDENTKRSRLAHFFRQSPDQPSSIPNLLRRFTSGEFGEKYLGKGPDLENPAVLARQEEVPGLSNFTTQWAKGVRNLEKEVGKFQLPPSVIRGFQNDPVFSHLSDELKVMDHNGNMVPLSSINNPHELHELIENQFQSDLDEASTMVDNDLLSQEEKGQLASAQGKIRSIYLEKATAESLKDPASRAVATAGINTRMDEFRGEVYKYLVARANILAGQSTSNIIQDLMDGVDKLSRQGRISGGEKTEARAAIMSMQMNIDGLGFGSSHSLERARAQLTGLQNSPAGSALEDISNYDTSLIHHRRYLGLEAKASRALLKQFGVRKQDVEGFRYNPFGADQDTTFVPTFESTFFEHPLRSLKSAAGISTWDDPEAFSAIGIRTSHLATRLNRYFAMAGVGVDETAYRGPMGLIAGGFVGRRVLPASIGAALFFGLDREVGGWVHGKDEQGNRQYTPLVSGTIATAIAHTIVVGAGILGGPGAYQEKKEQYFGDQDVPIRKGRYWPLGNQPWQGGRIQYYRPNWYKRFMSGYKYTDQTYGSPAEHLAYDYDFSPLHYMSPYHFEKKHFDDRPYPVTGDMFTGPWGPVGTVLNATVGKVLKPHELMHEDEFNQAMSENYQRVGEYGMQYVGENNPYPKVLTRAPSGGASIVAPTPAGYYLGTDTAGGSSGAPGDYTRPYDQPYGFVGQQFGTSPDQAIASYRGKGDRFIPGFGPGDADTLYTSGGPIQLKKPGGSAYNKITMARGRNFDPRIIPAANPLNPGSTQYQAGQFGYEAQEMAGIYGFGFGTAKQMLGFGDPNYTPDRPVLQEASRGYGTERSFWDLNLGGLGDFPTPIRGEYGNIEFSEIARRFVPHRRRDTNELNPIPNQMGTKYPWLPGSDYYINFDIGDPYIAIPEGEMRLPGQGYERTHQLHPDETGQYGLLDKHRILGDVAPWSEEYKAIDRIVRKSNLTAEEKEYAQTTRNQVAGVKKRHNFKPYKYAHSDFQDMDVKVVGFEPGEADRLITDAGVIQLAGVRARKGPDAMQVAQSMIHAGDTVSIQFDANASVPRNGPVNASITAANGQDLGSALLNANQGYMSTKNTQLDNRVRQGPISFYLHALLERAAHANTIINQKFVPNRSAVEEWERYHVYGTDFPQWTHPIQDFIEPLGQRARNRNPVYASTVLSFVGRAFGRTPQGKTAGSLIGAATGSYLSTTSNAKTLETGSRYIPKRREKELALDEYTDMLKYVKYAHLYNVERQQAIDQENSDPDKYAKEVEKGKFKKHQFTNLGPHTLAALEYRKEMKQTEYGADLFGDIMDESAALPKRKRDYFIPFINSPQNEHARILSTAPRLERRLYEAKWGMAIEDRPDLSQYFSEHELPGAGWEGWSPDVDLGNVELKMIQQQGLEASQMGYYPQQVQEANLINPSYPDFNQSQPQNEAAAKLRNLIYNSGLYGDVTIRRTSQPGTSVNLQMGVQNQYGQ